DNDQEAAKIKELMEIVLDEEEVAIDAIPLAVKSPSIMYSVFSQMLKSFDRQDLEDLYKLVKAKYESTRPVEDLDLILWNDLKGRIVRIKSSIMLFGVTAALIDVNAAQSNPPKRTSTSAAPAITLDAIRQLIADLATPEAQTAAHSKC
ncbi:hypothetical protein Tco_0295027, partial [Tanacetum coccineum]